MTTYTCSDFWFSSIYDHFKFDFSIGEHVTPQSNSYEFSFEGASSLNGSLYCNRENYDQVGEDELFIDDFTYELYGDPKYTDVCDYFLIIDGEIKCQGKITFYICDENCATCDKDSYCTSCITTPPNLVLVNREKCVDKDNEDLSNYYEDNGEYFSCHPNCDGCDKGGMMLQIIVKNAKEI